MLRFSALAFWLYCIFGWGAGCARKPLPSPYEEYEAKLNAGAPIVTLPEIKVAAGSFESVAKQLPKNIRARQRIVLEVKFTAATKSELPGTAMIRWYRKAVAGKYNRPVVDTVSHITKRDHSGTASIGMESPKFPGAYEVEVVWPRSKKEQPAIRFDTTVEP